MNLSEKLTGLGLFAMAWYWYNLQTALVVILLFVFIGVPLERFWAAEVNPKYGIGSPWLAEQQARKVKKSAAPRLIVSP